MLGRWVYVVILAGFRPRKFEGLQQPPCLVRKPMNLVHDHRGHLINIAMVGWLRQNLKTRPIPGIMQFCLLEHADSLSK